ncbi:hypothetical protein LOK49_LG12G00921 [Camellia lanceoleosa]|uniref:Uncharacterized protein n=1 Tax=Camellia lanceoleosa TaxID=1840588 RepID=A0ACC0FR43_9ERIC|nr:hypothetical protein LOK49_LG12G00921 [Camellia lanceoleosa]
MDMAVWNSWNSQFPSSIILLCFLFFTLYYFPLHATALNFSLINIDQTLQNREILIDSSSYITSEGIQAPAPAPTQTQTPTPNTVTSAFGKKIGAKTNKALVVGSIVGSLVLVGALALVSFVMWKKSRAKEDDKFAIELSMNNEFEATTLPILPAKMPVPTYFAPPVNASSLVSLTYGSATVSSSNQVQSSTYSYNTNSLKFTSSYATSSPSASLLYT